MPETETIPCRIRNRKGQRFLLPERKVPDLRPGDTIREDRLDGRVVLVIQRASAWRRVLIALRIVKAPANPPVERY